MYLLENPEHLHEFLGEVTDLPFALNLSGFIIRLNPLASEPYTKHQKNEVLRVPWWLCETANISARSS